MKLSISDIQKRIRKVQEENDIKILYACESGSRAWGFESKDSDYDIRFIYVRPVKDYIAVEQPPDVVEIPGDEVWDMNGWDLTKALKLLVKGNSNLLEWLHSPIPYIENPEFCSEMLDLVDRSVSAKKLYFSYQGMARNNYREYLHREIVWIKKYLYVLRPLLACHWIEKHNALPPVQFDELVEFGKLSFPYITESIDALLKMKRAGLEKEMGPKMPQLDRLIETMLSKDFEGNCDEKSVSLIELNRIFQRYVLSQSLELS